jgi:hypothetical protein
LFQQIADPTIFIRVIYTDAGVPNETAISGYNKVAEIPAGVVSNSGNTYDGLQITGLEIDATFTDVIAIENSDTIEITKTANYVSQLIVKE